MGGLGLRGAKSHAPGAHAASVLSSLYLIASLLGRPVQQGGEGAAEIRPGKEAGGEVAAEVRPGRQQGVLSPLLLALLSASQGEETVEESLRGVSQKQISYKVDLYQQQVWQQEFEEDEVRERARVASVSLPHAGDWLVVAPLVALGLHLRPQEFVLAVKYRLGLALFD